MGGCRLRVKGLWAKWLASSGLCLFGLMTTECRADAPRDRVGQELSTLRIWLGTDENAQRWHRYLSTDQLESQLAEKTPDVEQLSGVLQAYAGQAAGLDSRRFQAVRFALQDWVDAMRQPVQDDLAQTARAAKGQMTTDLAVSLDKARSEMHRSMEALDRYLAGGGSAKSDAWKKFLHWDELKAHSAAARPDKAALAGSLGPFIQPVSGLERPAFVRTRRAIHRYAEALVLADDPQGAQRISRHLEELAKQLDQYQKSPSGEAAAQIGTHLEWLTTTGQAPSLVHAVRTRHAQPNMFLSISRELIASAVDRDVKEPIQVDDYVMGTEIHGHGTTTAKVTARLIPSTASARLQLVTSGHTVLSSVGYNGPVAICSHSCTTMLGVKPIRLTGTGICADPATADCDTATEICSIEARRKLAHRLIERVAWKKAMESLPMAEAIASERAEERLQGRIDEQAEPLVAKANRQYATRIEQPLKKLEAFPERIHTQTTAEALLVIAVQATPWQLASSAPPPAAGPQGDVVLLVHESLINNSAESVLGGMTLTDQRLIELLEERKREIPEELKISPEKDPWSITFAPRLPVRVQFTADNVLVSIRGTRFTRADQVLNVTTDISARYQLSKGPKGAKATRLGDVEVNFINTEGRLSARQITFKTFLRRKFSAMFAEHFESDGIKLPEGLQRIGGIQLSELTASPGWLQAAWLRGSASTTGVAMR